MSDDLRVVFESRNRAACSDRALVLESVQIPYQIVDDPVSCALVVPAEHSAHAIDQLMLNRLQGKYQNQVGVTLPKL